PDPPRFCRKTRFRGGRAVDRTASRSTTAPRAYRSCAAVRYTARPNMTSLEPVGTPLPVGSSVKQGSLRALIEARRSQSAALTLKQAVGLVVPLAVELAELHDAGQAGYVYPSNLLGNEKGVSVDPAHFNAPPELTRDKTYLAPELREGGTGGARSSVYAVGALLYELVTLQTVGPTMQRPAVLVPTLPPDFEVILGKALVADPAHRPDDL